MKNNNDNDNDNDNNNDNMKRIKNQVIVDLSKDETKGYKEEVIVDLSIDDNDIDYKDDNKYYGIDEDEDILYSRKLQEEFDNHYAMKLQEEFDNQNALQSSSSSSLSSSSPIITNSPLSNALEFFPSSSSSSSSLLSFNSPLPDKMISWTCKSCKTFNSINNKGDEKFTCKNCPVINPAIVEWISRQRIVHNLYVKAATTSAMGLPTRSFRNVGSIINGILIEESSLVSCWGSEISPSPKPLAGI